MKAGVKEYISDHKRELSVMLIVVTVVIVGTLLIVYAMEGGEPSVPSGFSDASQRVGRLMPTLLTEANQSSLAVSEVAKLREEGNTALALERINEEKERVADIRKRVAKTPRDIEHMVNAIDNIEPKSAQRLARDATTSVTRLAQGLVKFSDYMAQMLNALELGISGVDTESEIAALVPQVNQEIIVINALSEQYNNLMLEFRAAMGSDAEVGQ